MLIMIMGSETSVTVQNQWDASALSAIFVGQNLIMA